MFNSSIEKQRQTQNNSGKNFLGGDEGILTGT